MRRRFLWSVCAELRKNGIPVMLRKTELSAISKFLKCLKTSFKKFLSGCRAEPCDV